jgi:hypothetical protein
LIGMSLLLGGMFGRRRRDGRGNAANSPILLLDSRTIAQLPSFGPCGQRHDPSRLAAVTTEGHPAGQLPPCALEPVQRGRRSRAWSATVRMSGDERSIREPST